MKIIFAISFLFGVLTFSSRGFADAKLSSQVLSGGGGTVASGSISMTGTLGQPVAGFSSSGQTRVTSGFWSSSIFIEIVHENAFEEWMANLPPEEQPPEGLRGPLDTPANDGVENLLKFAFGLLPMESAYGAGPQFIIDDLEGSIGVDFVRSKDAEVGLILWGSLDLESWEEIGFEVIVLEDGTPSENHEYVRLLTNVDPNQHPRYFLRLEVNVETPDP